MLKVNKITFVYFSTLIFTTTVLANEYSLENVDEVFKMHNPCKLMVLKKLDAASKYLTKFNQLAHKYPRKIEENEAKEFIQTVGGAQNAIDHLRHFSQLINHRISMNNFTRSSSVIVRILTSNCTFQKKRLTTTLNVMDNFRHSVRTISRLLGIRSPEISKIHESISPLFITFRNFKHSNGMPEQKHFLKTCRNTHHGIGTIFKDFYNLVFDAKSRNLRSLADLHTNGFKSPQLVTILADLYSIWITISILEQSCQIKSNFNR
jgi:hypothetical protein